MTLSANIVKGGAVFGEISIPGYIPYSGPLDRLLTDQEVAQLISKVDPFSLQSVSAEKVATLPKTAGVYFLIVNNEIVYVGESCNIGTRWRRHKHLDAFRQPEARLAYWPMPNYGFLRYRREQIERLFINQLRPALNKKMTNPRCGETDSPGALRKI